MEKLIDHIQKNIVAGIVILLPIFVFLAIFGRFWGFFQKYGDKFAKLIHIDHILGKSGADFLGGLFLLLLIYCSGYLVSLHFFKTFSDWIDKKLMIFIPGYEKSKKEAEEKLIKSKKEVNTNLPVLFKNGDYWQPAYLIEEDKEGRVAVFVPVAPAKEMGQIYIANLSQIQKLNETTISSLDHSIKSLGKGILAFK